MKYDGKMFEFYKTHVIFLWLYYTRLDRDQSAVSPIILVHHENMVDDNEEDDRSPVP